MPSLPEAEIFTSGVYEIQFFFRVRERRGMGAVCRYRVYRTEVGKEGEGN